MKLILKCHVPTVFVHLITFYKINFPKISTCWTPPVITAALLNFYIWAFRVWTWENNIKILSTSPWKGHEWRLLHGCSGSVMVNAGGAQRSVREECRICEGRQQEHVSEKQADGAWWRTEQEGWLSNLAAICLHAAVSFQHPLGIHSFPDKLVASSAKGDLALSVTDRHSVLGVVRSKSKVWASQLITNYSLDGEDWSFPGG